MASANKNADQPAHPGCIKTLSAIICLTFSAVSNLAFCWSNTTFNTQTTAEYDRNVIKESCSGNNRPCRKSQKISDTQKLLNYPKIIFK